MPKSLGETVRARREELRITLRGAAAQLGVSPAYLSGLERGQESPTPERVAQLAKLLELPEDALFALASQVAPELARYITATPAVPAFLRVARKYRLSNEAIAKLADEIRVRHGGGPRRGGGGAK